MTTSTIKTLFAVITTVLLVGCIKEAEQQKQDLIGQEVLHEVVFHAGWDSETKTILQDNGQVWWSPGDSIALFIKATDKNYCLKATCAEPSPTTDFVGKIGEVDDESSLYAIYPYKNYYSDSNPTTVTIPSVQYATAGGFSPGQFVSIARLDNKNLSFYNLCAGVKFSVAHDGISKIIFKNRENWEPITGDMSCFFFNGTSETLNIYPRSSDGYTSSYTLTVFPAEGNYFIPGKDYYASLKPGLTSFVISYYTDDKVATTSLSYRDLGRSKIAVLKEKDKDLQFENNEDFTYSMLGEDILPEGVNKQSIQEVVFHTLSDVTTSTVIPSSIPNSYQDYIPVYFELQGTTAHYYTKADRYMMTGPNCVSFEDWRELRSADLSMFCTNQVISFAYMFKGCVRLESVNLSSFDTGSAQSFGWMFERCKSLKSLDLSNFSSQSLVASEGADGIFNRCYDLVKLDLSNFDLSTCGADHAMLWFAKYSKNCAIRCTSATRTKLSGSISKLGASADYITWVLPEETIPDLEPILDHSLYTSTNYSKDKTVRKLHQATQGNGVDIVLLGDAYSDRMIADGTYDADMELAMNAILEYEPYASFKDYINVNTVYAVSKNEIPYSTPTAFDASINYYDPVNGVLSYWEAEDVYRYASIAFPDKELEDIAIVLIINQAEGDGDSWTDGIAGYELTYQGTDYTNAHYRWVGAINRRNRSKTKEFSNIVTHEFGHVFSKLADEYILNYDEIPDWNKSYLIGQYTYLGWWGNADFTDDPQTIRWSRFLEDARYSGTGIGVYDGGHTYAYGVWHPSVDSIMNADDGTKKMFNAPSREAIYKRIHKLALGKEWQYDYETFVEYDQKNITAEKAAQSAQSPIQSPSRVNHHHIFKMEESIAPDGRKKVQVIMN